MKKTFNQNFIIRKVKQKSRATTLVYLRITVDGARTELSLQRESDPDRWDSDRGRLSGKTEEVKSFNAYLDAVQLKIYDIFQSFISTGIDFDGEKINARYLGFDIEKPRMFLDVYEEHNKEFEALVGKGLSYRTLHQLKSEINLKEFNFGLLREYVEDYPEIVLRELLINAIVHRDYSRQQIIEIRKYPGYIEFESPGTFPDGVTELNYLRKTNPRNPNIMDVFREINYAEKAGSGFDKIFTALLTKGKSLPKPLQTDPSVVFKIEAESYSEKLIELSMLYRNIKKKDIDLETILVLNAIYINKNRTLQELAETPFINEYQLKRILDELLDLEFIESTGKTSGIKYLIHKSKLADLKDEMLYLKHKKQEKAKQEQAILRYLDEFSEIDNESARKFLNLPDSEIYNVSRLFSDMVTKGWIKPLRREKQKTFYGKP